MNDTSPEANYVARMQDRISTMEVRVPEHLPSTEALFAATAQLREQVLDQRDDAHMAAGLLERNGARSTGTTAHRLQSGAGIRARHQPSGTALPSHSLRA